MWGSKCHEICYMERAKKMGRTYARWKTKKTSKNMPEKRPENMPDRTLGKQAADIFKKKWNKLRKIPQKGVLAWWGNKNMPEPMSGI